MTAIRSWKSAHSTIKFSFWRQKCFELPTPSILTRVHVYRREMYTTNFNNQEAIQQIKHCYTNSIISPLYRGIQPLLAKGHNRYCGLRVGDPCPSTFQTGRRHYFDQRKYGQTYTRRRIMSETGLYPDGDDEKLSVWQPSLLSLFIWLVTWVTLARRFQHLTTYHDVRIIHCIHLLYEWSISRPTVRHFGSL
jgi:hypothetical protein